MSSSHVIGRNPYRLIQRPRATTVATVLLGSVLITFALGAATPTLAQQEEEISATAQLTFDPENITVTEGTTVTWVWEGGGAHTVTSTDSLEQHEPNGEFDYELTEDSGPVEHTFDEAGTYHYFCKPHSAQGMQGTVVVEAADGETPTDEETPTDDETPTDEETPTEEEEDETETEPFAGEDPGETETEEEEDTPGVGFMLSVVLISGLVAVVRRSHRTESGRR